MSRPDERIRLFAAYMNISGAGTLVGAIVTGPLGLLSSRDLEPLSKTTVELIWIGVSVLLLLIAQGVLGWVRS